MNIPDNENPGKLEYYSRDELILRCRNIEHQLGILTVEMNRTKAFLAMYQENTYCTNCDKKVKIIVRIDGNKYCKQCNHEI